jgi:hypothetical protein
MDGTSPPAAVFALPWMPQARPSSSSRTRLAPSIASASALSDAAANHHASDPSPAPPCPAAISSRLHGCRKPARRRAPPSPRTRLALPAAGASALSGSTANHRAPAPSPAPPCPAAMRGRERVWERGVVEWIRWKWTGKDRKEEEIRRKEKKGGKRKKEREDKKWEKMNYLFL